MSVLAFRYQGTDTEKLPLEFFGTEHRIMLLEQASDPKDIGVRNTMVSFDIPVATALLFKAAKQYNSRRSSFKIQINRNTVWNFDHQNIHKLADNPILKALSCAKAQKCPTFWQYEAPKRWVLTCQDTFPLPNHREILDAECKILKAYVTRWGAEPADHRQMAQQLQRQFQVREQELVEEIHMLKRKNLEQHAQIRELEDMVDSLERSAKRFRKTDSVCDTEQLHNQIEALAKDVVEEKKAHSITRESRDIERHKRQYDANYFHRLLKDIKEKCGVAFQLLQQPPLPQPPQP